MSKVKDAFRDAVQTLDDMTEFDEEVTKFVKSKRSKVKFFWKAGKDYSHFNDGNSCHANRNNRSSDRGAFPLVPHPFKKVSLKSPFFMTWHQIEDKGKGQYCHKSHKIRVGAHSSKIFFAINCQIKALSSSR